MAANRIQIHGQLRDGTETVLKDALSDSRKALLAPFSEGMPSEDVSPENTGELLFRLLAHFETWRDFKAGPEVQALLDEHAARFYNTLPTSADLPQLEDRFAASSSDGAFVGFGKLYKQRVRRWEQNRNTIGNVIRGWFKAKPRPLRVWMQRIPVANVAKAELAKLYLTWEQSILADLLTRNNAVIQVLEHTQVLTTRLEADSPDQLLDSIKDAPSSVDETIEARNGRSEDEITDICAEWLESCIQTIEQTGTLERSSARYKKNVNAAYTPSAAFARRATNLNTEFDILLSTLRSRIEFFVLHQQISALSASFQEKVAEAWDKELLKPITGFENAFNKSIDEFGSDEDMLDEKQVGKLATNIKRHLNRYFPPQKAGEETEVPSPEPIFAEFLQEAEACFNELSETINLVKPRDRATENLTTEPGAVEWKALCWHYFNETVQRGTKTLAAEFESDRNTLLSGAIQIGTSADVNVSSARETIAEGETAKEELIVAFKEGAGRISRRIAKLRAEFEAKSQRKRHFFGELTGNALRVLTQNVAAYSLQNLVRRQRTEAMQNTANSWGNAAAAYSAKTADDVYKGFTRFREAAQKQRRQLSELFGFVGASGKGGSVQVDISRVLTDFQQRVDKLPLIYKRLFDPEIETQERFYVPPVSLGTTFEEAYSHWNSGQFANMAIIGENDSGKSAFARHAAKRFLGDCNIIDIPVAQGTTTVDGLCEAIAAAFGWQKAVPPETIVERMAKRTSKTVCMIEPLEHLYMKEIDGFQALNTMFWILSHAPKNVFWVVSANRYAWDYLNKVVGAADYFTHVGFSDRLGDENVRKVIDLRHQSSGYDCVFDPPKGVEKTRAYRKLLNDPVAIQTFLSDRYFGRLAEIANGNPGLALLFWLQSIKNITDTEIIIGSIDQTIHGIGDSLDAADLFTLTAILQNGPVNAEEHARILNVEASRSQLRLLRLSARGYMIERDSRYTINPVLYRPIVRKLKTRNLLH